MPFVIGAFARRVLPARLEVLASHKDPTNHSVTRAHNA